MPGRKIILENISLEVNRADFESELSESCGGSSRIVTIESEQVHSLETSLELGNQCKTGQ